MTAKTKAKTKAKPAATANDGDIYHAESDLRTLIEAAKIHKHPDRHKSAMAKHAEMMAALQSIQAQQGPAMGQPQPQPAGATPPTANMGAY